MSDTVNRKLLKGDSYTGLKETFRYGGMFTKDFTKTAKQRTEKRYKEQVYGVRSC